jgi:oligoribonuclease NrnB/cAMP/cGMP phosphodiesterase (DHH superfamily)
MKNFYSKLKNYKVANLKQRKTELWDVEGILHNQKFKFDTRPIKNNIKIGSFKTKADKMVFDIKDQYIIVDVEELHKYIKKNKFTKLYLDSLLKELDWNIILEKSKCK